MVHRLAEKAVKYWLPVGLLAIFLAWTAIFILEPIYAWDLPGMTMRFMYFSYALGAYVFIRRLGIKNLNFLWGIFCIGLAVDIMSGITVSLAPVSAVMRTAVSAIGILVITLGIYYAADEWKRKNRSLRTEIKTRTEKEEELRKREHELENALRKTVTLKEVNRLKSKFLSITSHELRTPISPILMQIQMLIQERFGKLSGRQKKSLEMVMRNTKRLDRLISDILDISRLQISSMKFDFEKNDLNGVIKHAVETMKYSAKDKKIIIRFTEKGIPLFVFDRDRITQVITDLINNAIKYIPEGGRIDISASKTENKVTVKVKDTGIGISKKDMGDLFRPFSQIENSETKKYGGVGLGLSICKGIIESHKGKIWVESGGSGKGSTFIFRVPFIKRVSEEGEVK